jgi:hypothetical protein
MADLALLCFDGSELAEEAIRRAGVRGSCTKQVVQCS